MAKLHVRIDDRLIHGQIITAWCKYLNIQSIIAVDNSLADNKMVKDIMLMGIPKSFDPKIVSETEALELLESDKNILLITRFPRHLTSMIEKIEHANEVNIGNSAKQSDSIFMSKGFGVGNILCFNQTDVDALNLLEDKGIRVISQQMPSDKPINWSALKQNLVKI